MRNNIVGWVGLDDLLQDEQEYNKGKKRRKILTVLFGVALIALLLTAYAYDHFKPLPQIPYCKGEGYEAGIEKKGTIICYSDCPTNDINDCKRIKAVRK